MVDGILTTDMGQVSGFDLSALAVALAGVGHVALAGSPGVLRGTAKSHSTYPSHFFFERPLRVVSLL